MQYQSANVIASDREISDRLTTKIQNHLLRQVLRQDFQATPLVNVSVLEPPIHNL